MNYNLYSELKKSLFLPTLIIIAYTLVIGLSALHTQSLSAISLTPSGNTKSVGGDGGSPVGPFPCPAGTIAIGMNGNEINQTTSDNNGFLAAYTTRCGTFDIDSKTFAVTTTFTVNSAVASVGTGDTRGTAVTIDCPSGSVVSGFNGYERPHATFTFNGSPTILVDALRPRCSQLIYDGKSLTIGPSTDVAGLALIPSPAGATATPIGNADCPSGSMLSGFMGRTGQLFDKFQLDCAIINQAGLTITIDNPTPNDYEIQVKDDLGNITKFTNLLPGLLVPGTYTITLVNTVTAKTYSNFTCTPTTPTSTSPYTINLANNTNNNCTITPEVIVATPLNILQIDNKTVNATTPVELTTTKPVISGNAKPNADIVVKDQSGTTICTTKSDSAGLWNCTPTTNLLYDKTYDLTATENLTKVSSIAKIIIKKPVVVTTPLTISKVESITPNDLTYSEISTNYPKFSGEAKPNSTVVLKDQYAYTLCTTTTDATGKWNCTSSKMLTAGNKYDVIATEDDTKLSNVAKIVIANAPVILPQPIPPSTSVPTPTPQPIVKSVALASNPTPRTGGNNNYNLLLSISIVGWLLLLIRMKTISFD
jgi:hypothetical protein